MNTRATGASTRQRGLSAHAAQRNSATATRTAAHACASVSRPAGSSRARVRERSEEHTSELQSRFDLVCRLLLEKKKQPIPCEHSATTPPHNNSDRAQSHRAPCT